MPDILAVVLVHAAVPDIVHKVIFVQNASAALVWIKPPTAVARGIDVVNQIVAHRRSFGRSEGIDAPHIAQNAITEVVKMIVFNAIPFGDALAVTPAPAH